jgi:hypothetical protein
MPVEVMFTPSSMEISQLVIWGYRSSDLVDTNSMVM